MLRQPLRQQHPIPTTMEDAPESTARMLTVRAEWREADPKPTEKQLLRSAVGYGFGRDGDGQREDSRDGGKN